jgi:hypothetical protein
MSSHHLPDPEPIDYADLAARHAAAQSECERQARLAETALLHLQQARNEVGRLRDALDRQRRRPGLGMAAVLAIALAALGGGFGLGVSHGSGTLVGAGEPGCETRPDLPPR